MAVEGDLKKYSTIAEGYREDSPLTFDELVDENGNVRAHWRDFMKTQEKLGVNEIKMRKKELKNVLDENGVTFNAYTENSSQNRPWDLDPCPLILDGVEWDSLDEGLVQRAHLFNEMYKDIYGEQRLIKEGILPADLIYQHPGFNRNAMGIELPGIHRILQCSFNLVRGADNQWWVLSDRMQVTQGSGYALETRIAMSQVYPNLMRHCEVHRLATYFKQTHKTLIDIAQNTHPTIVLLSPGPSNETYFEDAYLANYQGYTLVQGDDLVVRDGYVWIKTLQGLKKVDVILRRISDQFSDPLELRPDSFIGVPGLLESVRQKKVIVVNPIGSWILENPGFYPYLEGCCEFLLKEKLKIASVATWWCGEQKAQKHVFENIDSMVIKHIYKRELIQFGNTLSELEKESLIQTILKNPTLYVAQQMLNVSTMPTWKTDKLEPRNGVLRTFLTAKDKTYSLMPGGLACVATKNNQGVVSTQNGAINKDTWVRASESRPLLPFVSNQSKQQFAPPNTRSITSRTAENLFWLGRYSQRAEIIARMIRQIIRNYFENFNEDGRLNDTGLSILNSLKEFTFYVEPAEEVIVEPEINAENIKQSQQQQQLQQQTQRQAQLNSNNDDNDEDSDFTDDIFTIALNPEVSGGLFNVLNLFNQSAFHSRDVWSNDSWRLIDDISNFTRDAAKDHRLVGLLRSCETLLTSLLALNGLIADSMNHDDGWRMLDVGRLLERSINLSHLVSNTIAQDIDQHKDNENELLAAILSCNDNTMNFRRYYRADMDSYSVLNYILLNKFNPRGMAFGLARLLEHVRIIFDEKNGQITDAERSILNAYTQVQLIDVQKILTIPSDDIQSLKTLINHTQLILENVAYEIGAKCFIHTQKSRSMR
ncbi:circularly permuted type 2 ATP-grasp protein [Marinicellulosiphila megalodicopiae]|uniref:circularly permuted type 2 ATP-grasp protein n=1 Tax=Marinicellulosiphila megalodicopiae TaxID=2724896 RepID=UPI003BAF03B6